MRIQRLFAALLVALMLSALGSIAPKPAAAASDSPITIAITATVQTVYDHGNVLNGAIQPGDTITGTYTYNAAASDTNSLATVGDYWHPPKPYGVSLNLNGLASE